MAFPCIRLMKTMGQGQVMIASSLKAFLPFAEHVLYASSKAALLKLSESLLFCFFPTTLASQ